MDVNTVKKCSKQLEELLEQHNALDTRVRSQIQEVIEALKAAEVEETEERRHVALLAISNLLRSATNIADIISRFWNE